MPRAAIPDYLLATKQPIPLPSDGRALINSATTRALAGGITNVALHRWMYGNPSTGTAPVRPDFPKPVKRIGNRRYWRLGEVLSWLAASDMPSEGHDRPAKGDEPSEDRAARRRLSHPRREPAESGS